VFVCVRAYVRACVHACVGVERKFGGTTVSGLFLCRLVSCGLFSVKKVLR